MMLWSAVGEACRLLMGGVCRSRHTSRRLTCTLVLLPFHGKAGRVVQAPACVSVNAPAWQLPT